MLGFGPHGHLQLSWPRRGKEFVWGLWPALSAEPARFHPSASDSSSALHTGILTEPLRLPHRERLAGIYLQDHGSQQRRLRQPVGPQHRAAAPTSTSSADGSWISPWRCALHRRIVSHALSNRRPRIPVQRPSPRVSALASSRRRPRRSAATPTPTAPATRRALRARCSLRTANRRALLASSTDRAHLMQRLRRVLRQQLLRFRPRRALSRSLSASTMSTTTWHSTSPTSGWRSAPCTSKRSRTDSWSLPAPFRPYATSRYSSPEPAALRRERPGQHEGHHLAPDLAPNSTPRPLATRS